MLVVLGWLVIVVLALYGTAGVIFGIVGIFSLGQRVGWQIIIPIAIVIGLWYMVVINFPFVVVLT